MPGDDQATVHIEFAEAKRRIDQQLPLRRAVDKLTPSGGPEPSPKGCLCAVGGLPLRDRLFRIKLSKQTS